MKKIILFALIAIVFTGCEKEEKSSVDVEMYFYAYYKYDPLSIAKKTNAKFFLFDASNGQQFKEERIEVPSGDYFEYGKINSEMITLLRNNEYELKDGTRVKPIVVKTGYSGDYYIYVCTDFNDPEKWNNLISYNKVNIPYGKYYVVALWANGIGVGGWQSVGKYSGKYIEIKENMPTSDKTISITFPFDGKHKGFIDWITTSWDNN